MLSATREATVVHVYNTAIKSKASTVIERSRVLSTEQGAEFPEGEANGSTCSRTNITKARCHSRQLKKRRMCVQPQHSGTSCEPLTVSKTRLQRPTRVTPKTESGTPPRHQTDASLENQRHSKRRRGSDGEYTGPTSTAALLGDIDTLTDTVTSQPDTKRCIQVGRETYAVLSQPGTSNTGQMALHIQVGRATSALTPVTDISRTVSGTPSIHHDEETITFYDSSANLTMESTSPQGYHRRKKNRTGQARHAKAQSGAPHRK